MKNIVKINIFALFFIALFISSCEKDKHTGYSTLVNRSPQLTEFIPSVISTLDKDTVIDISFELPDFPIVDAHITVQSISGTAVEGEDFEIITPQVVIPAFTKKGTVSIQILADDVVEGLEDFVIQVGDSTDANIKVFKNITFNLNDYISPELTITFEWNTLVDVPGAGIFPTGPNFDLDFYLFDDMQNDLGIYDAATGDYPESLSFSTPDNVGEYYIYVNLWNNVFRTEGTGLTDLQPVTMKFHRAGSLAEYVKIQPDSTSFNLDSPDSSNDGDATFTFLGKLVVTNTSYMFYDTDDTLLITARRRQPLINDIPAQVKSKHRKTIIEK